MCWQPKSDTIEEWDGPGIEKILLGSSWWIRASRLGDCEALDGPGNDIDEWVAVCGALEGPGMEVEDGSEDCGGEIEEVAAEFLADWPGIEVWDGSDEWVGACEMLEGPYPEGGDGSDDWVGACEELKGGGKEVEVLDLVTICILDLTMVPWPKKGKKISY